MKKKATRRYNNGTTGVSVQDYMQSPADILAENDILMTEAELEAQNNPWAKGIEVGSALLSSAASSGALAEGINPEGKSFGEFFGKNKTVMAKGSKGVPSNADAEVEGGEAYETPNGETGEFQGPTHEEGGMPMDVVPPNQPMADGQLPEKSKIYSDRIIKDGKKLSDKKLDREKRQLKLEKMLEGNSDIAIKNAVQRKISSLEREDQEDLNFQEMATAYEELAKTAFAPQEAQGEPEKLQYGTDSVGDPNKSDYDEEIEAERLRQERIAQGLEDDSLALDEAKSAEDLAADTDYLQMTSMDAFKNVDTGVGKDGMVDRSKVTAGEDEKSTFDTYLPKAGDLVGQIGNIYSTFAPMKNTLQNRAGDSPNINAYKQYGKKALTTLDKAGEGIKAEEAIANQRLLGRARASKKSARQSRGYSQVKGGEQMVDMTTNQGAQDIALASAKQAMELMAKKAGLEAKVDEVVMGGEQAKDIADRKDRDNFFTQMSENIAGKGEGIQTIGKDMNAVAMNPQVLKLLQQLGKYVSYDSKGNLIAKKTQA